MNLTPIELDTLRKHLKTLSIRYEETFNEFLDHYALLTEERMATGLPFDEARRLAFIDMGGEHELKDIEREYEKRWSSEYAKRHWKMVGDCFRWPRLVYSLLLGVLMFQIAGVATTRVVYVLMLVVAFLPSFTALFTLSLPKIVPYFQGKRSRFASIKDSALTGRLLVLMAPVHIYQAIRYSIEMDARINNPTVTAVLAVCCFFMVLYAAGLVRLYRENFRIRKA